MCVLFHGTGINIVPNGITLIMEKAGRCSGEGFVGVATKEDVEKALKLDRQSIGRRYIVFL